MLPSPTGPGTPAPETAASGSGNRPALTHAEALLRRLKNDRELLAADPAASSVKERYEKYLAGIDTNDTRWTARIREVVAEASEDSDALLATKEKLGRSSVSPHQVKSTDRAQ
jgi:hypothetical protein